MVTPHEHVCRSPYLEADLTGDIVNDRDLDLFHRLVGIKPINKALYGMLGPGVFLVVAYAAIACYRQRQRAQETRRTGCEVRSVVTQYSIPGE